MTRRRLLRVTAPHFVAGAEWEFRHGWECVNAADIIKWMIGMTPTKVVKYLNKKGWEYEWVKTDDQ